MSEARESTAWAMIPSARRMTGASSAPANASMSAGSSSVTPPMASMSSPARWSNPYALRTAMSITDAGATIARMRRARAANRTSSIATTFVGSVQTMTSVPSGSSRSGSSP